MRAAEKVPSPLLEEVEGLSYGDRDAGNILIRDDNLEALKALLPYNTGSAFEHYDDNLEHSQWPAMMAGTAAGVAGRRWLNLGQY